MSDDAKKTILARRARFVAAAIAGAGAACDPGTPPQACLSVTAPVYYPDAAPTVTDAGAVIAEAAAPESTDAGAPPMPCLSVRAPDPDPDAGPPPQPCLSPVPNPTATATPPRVCLSRAIPRPDKGNP